MKVVVVFRKRLSSKPEMAIFDDVKIDDILNINKRKPIIPNKWIIEELGIGESLIETYTKKHKIIKKSFNPDFSS
jgi:hypothetical protein